MNIPVLIDPPAPHADPNLSHEHKKKTFGRDALFYAFAMNGTEAFSDTSALKKHHESGQYKIIRLFLFVTYTIT